MNLNQSLSDEAIAVEIGRRLARIRLGKNLSQDDLAEHAGIGVATLQRLEAGNVGSFSTFVRVLRALELLDRLDQSVPEPLANPLDQLKRQGRQRKRAGRPRDVKADRPPWHWGDESA